MPSNPRPHIALPCVLLLLFQATAIISNPPTVQASAEVSPLAYFSGRQTVPVGAEPKDIATADFNGDGFEDLVTANRSSGNISLLLGSSGGTFGAANNFATRLDPTSLAVGDFNKDGKIDVVVAHGGFDLGNLSVHLGDGSGQLGAPTTFFIGGSPGVITVEDFNKDGNADLAVTNTTFEGTDIDNVYILLGTGTGGFGPPAKFPAGPRPRSIAVGDFNKDGNSDLAVADVRFNANKISILLGTGTGEFGAPTQFAVGSSPISLSVGDFNKDGNSDLAVANTDSHNISVLLGTGTGGFGPATNFPAGSSFPLSVIVGDYNADGEQDLAVGFNSSQFSVVAVLHGGGTGTFGAPVTFTTPAGPTEITGGDFNDDGQSDVASANAAANSVSVLLSPLVKASINDATVTEGTGGTTQADFTVTLSAAVSEPVFIAYSVQGVTANNSDFNPVVSDLIIPAGSLSGTITVQVVGDSTHEPDETFRVLLGSSRNALVADGEGIGTIVNDDPVPTVSVNDIAVSEGDSGTRNATFTVSLSNPSFQTVSVSFSTIDGTANSPGDYSAQGGTVTIAPGAVSGTLVIPVNGDTLLEGDEDFFVALSNPVNATIAKAQGRGVIVNDDPKVQFDVSSVTVTEGTDHSVTLNVTRAGDLASVTTVSYETLPGTASDRSDYIAAYGTLRFAPGETTKSITVIITDDARSEAQEAFTVRFSGVTGGGINAPGFVTVRINSNDAANGISPVRDAAFNTEFFVRQHYADFLNRVPDAGGLQFWIDNIESCGANQQCREVRKVDTSAAFFLSIENQETGFLAIRTHRAAFGNLAGKPVPLTLRSFLADSRQIGDGVIVGTPGWPEQLNANKVAYFNEFVTRTAFTTLYPPGMTATEFVDALFAKAGVLPTQAERDEAVAAFGGGATAGRAAALRSVAESQTLKTAETNKAFVLMQYFGYLRRNPDDPDFQGNPDPQFLGYTFWLTKLNQFNGNYVDAEMVKAFIQSIEYGDRFGQ